MIYSLINNNHQYSESVQCTWWYCIQHSGIYSSRVRWYRLYHRFDIPTLLCILTYKLIFGQYWDKECWAWLMFWLARKASRVIRRSVWCLVAGTFYVPVGNGDQWIALCFCFAALRSAVSIKLIMPRTLAQMDSRGSPVWFPRCAAAAFVSGSTSGLCIYAIQRWDSGFENIEKKAL